MKIKIAIFFCFVLLLAAGCGKDPCKGIECQNEGNCLEGICECPPEYEGDLCQYVAISPYLGTYMVTYEGCFQTSPNHKVAVAEVPGIPESIQLNDLGNYACPNNEPFWVANVSLTGFSIPEQTICADDSFDGYVVSGSGNRQGDTLSINFEVRFEADGVIRQDNCTATLIKE